MLSRSSIREDKSPLQLNKLVEKFGKFVGACQFMNQAYVAKHFELINVFSTLKSLYNRFKALNHVTGQQIGNISRLIDGARQDLSPDKMQTLEDQQNKIIFDTYVLSQNLSKTMSTLADNPGSYLKCDDSLQDVINSVVQFIESNDNTDTVIGDSIILESPDDIYGKIVVSPEELPQECFTNDKDGTKISQYFLDGSDLSIQKKFETLWDELDLSSLHRIFDFVSRKLNEEELVEQRNLVMYMSLLQSHTRNPYLKINKNVEPWFFYDTVDDTVLPLDFGAPTISQLQDMFTAVNGIDARLSIILEYDTDLHAETALTTNQKFFFDTTSISVGDLKPLYFKSIKRISLPVDKFGIIFELALRYELWDLGNHNTATDSSFLAIPRNVKLKFSLDEISKEVMNQNPATTTQNWALFVVFENKNKSMTGDKIFQGFVFNLTPELHYYLINLSVIAPIQIQIDETIIKTITLSSPPENAENDENNKTMLTLQRIQNDQVDIDPNLAKWIWYLSVLKAKVFGKFVSYIIENKISGRDQDLSLPGLTPQQTQKVAELIQTIGPGPVLDEEVLQLLQRAPGQENAISEEIFRIFTPDFLVTLTNILYDSELEE